LWRERLDVFLSRERVETLRRGGLRRRGTGEAASHPVQAADGNSVREEWRAPLARLAALSMGEGLDLSIVLSSCFARFQVLPWMEEVQTDEERKAYAGIHFRQVYGVAAESWEIMVSEEPPGQASLACALDRALLEALHALAVEKACRLVSVQPAFALAWNRWRTRLDGQGGFFALAEDTALCLGSMGSGQWRSVRNRRLAGTSLSDALAAALEEQEMAGDMPLPGARRCLADVDGSAPAVPGWLVLDGGWRSWL
jgi:hypothetical protein